MGGKNAPPHLPRQSTKKKNTTTTFSGLVQSFFFYASLTHNVLLRYAPVPDEPPDTTL